MRERDRVSTTRRLGIHLGFRLLVLSAAVLGASPADALAAGKMYWAHDSTIQRANLDGSAIETLVPDAGYVRSLALDRTAGRMYWIDYNRIQRANLDGTNIETLVTGLPQPVTLALDAPSGKMYWTHNPWLTGSADIRRANLDGSDIESLVTDLHFPRSLALDPKSGRMYWANDGAIQRATLDGRRVVTLVTGLSDSVYLALDPPASPCPVLTTMRDAPEREAVLPTVYRFRNEVLTKSPEGRRYIRLYYRHALEGTRLLLRHPDLRAHARDVLARLRPALEAAADGQPTAWTGDDVAAVESLMDAFSARASPGLRWTIRRLRFGLRHGRFESLRGKGSEAER